LCRLPLPLPPPTADDDDDIDAPSIDPSISDVRRFDAAADDDGDKNF
jgi:hypothetical protein